jgi:hypothetical protein
VFQVDREGSGRAGSSTTKNASGPTKHGFGLDDYERLLPVRPKSGQKSQNNRSSWAELMRRLDMSAKDAQLRGLEGKLEKSLAAQGRLEHRKQTISGELDKGFEPAARYEELKHRLDVLNRELTKVGVEIETTPELSKLDEDAFRPIESVVIYVNLTSST